MITMMGAIRKKWPVIEREGRAAFVLRYGVLRLGFMLAVVYGLSVFIGSESGFAISSLLLPVGVAIAVGAVWGLMTFEHLRRSPGASGRS